MKKKLELLAFVILVLIISVFLSSHKNESTPVLQEKSVSNTIAEKAKLNEFRRLFNYPKSNFANADRKTDFSDISSELNDGVFPRIALFFQTGKMEVIRGITIEDIQAAIKIYVSMHTTDQLAESLNQYLKMPFGLFASISKPEDYFMEATYLIRNEIDKSSVKSNLIITDSCLKDGAITGATHLISSGISKIYAVFENNDALQGLDTIYVVWRDLNNDSMKFSQFETLRRNSSYNYVWLELKEGWSAGLYQLDLADPTSPSKILATTKFKVF